MGVGEYINYGSEVGFGEAPPYDLIYQILSKWKFGPEKVGFSKIDYIADSDATKSNILQEIASTFSEADENDISYFYFGGHGGKDGNIYYICPTDMTSSVNSQITVNELEESLSVVPGTKVVIIDSCYSGGFISLFTADCYQVLTSCTSNQICFPINSGGNTMGAFTAALIGGCGYYYSDFPADSNSNGEVTLEEAYLYVKDEISSWGLTQDVQVYPINSTFVFAGY